MKRRSFLATTSAFAFLAGSLSWRAAYGQSALSDTQQKSLLRMVRDIFPHDALSDEPYLAIVDQLNTAAADSGTYALLVEGLKGLDDAVGGVWTDQNETTRISALETIQFTPFFITVRVTALFSLYANPVNWPAFGYEGESYSQGGYLFRGFDDIDWLPEPES